MTKNEEKKYKNLLRGHRQRGSIVFSERGNTPEDETENITDLPVIETFVETRNVPHQQQVERRGERYNPLEFMSLENGQIDTSRFYERVRKVYPNGRFSQEDQNILNDIFRYVKANIFYDVYENGNSRLAGIRSSGSNEKMTKKFNKNIEKVLKSQTDREKKVALVILCGNVMEDLIIKIANSRNDLNVNEANQALRV